MNNPYLVAALSIGIAVGACAREVVRGASPAVAHAAAPGRYKVIFANPNDWEEMERQLNAHAASGWKYVGSLGATMVLER